MATVTNLANGDKLDLSLVRSQHYTDTWGLYRGDDLVIEGDERDILEKLVGIAGIPVMELDGEYWDVPGGGGLFKSLADLTANEARLSRLVWDVDRQLDCDPQTGLCYDEDGDVVIETGATGNGTDTNS